MYKSEYQFRPPHGCRDRVDMCLEVLNKNLRNFINTRRSNSLRAKITIHDAARTLSEISTIAKESDKK